MKLRGISDAIASLTRCLQGGGSDGGIAYHVTLRRGIGNNTTLQHFRCITSIADPACVQLFVLLNVFLVLVGNLLLAPAGEIILQSGCQGRGRQPPRLGREQLRHLPLRASLRNAAWLILRMGRRPV